MTRKRNLRLSASFTVLSLALCVFWATYPQRMALAQQSITSGAAIAVEKLNGKIAVEEFRTSDIERQILELKTQQQKSLDAIAQHDKELAAISGAQAQMYYLGAIAALVLAIIGLVNVGLNVLRRSAQKIIDGTETSELSLQENIRHERANEGSRGEKPPDSGSRKPRKQE